jgi:hypothetical protein
MSLWHAVYCWEVNNLVQTRWNINDNECIERLMYTWPASYLYHLVNIVWTPSPCTADYYQLLLVVGRVSQRSDSDCHRTIGSGRYILDLQGLDSFVVGPARKTQGSMTIYHVGGSDPQIFWSSPTLEKSCCTSQPDIISRSPPPTGTFPPCSTCQRPASANCLSHLVPSRPR